MADSNLPKPDDSKIYHASSLPQVDAIFKAHTYVFVDFYADWCGPCRQIAPFFAQLSTQHSRETQLAFVKVNVDNAKDVAMKYRVSAMPTFMFFKEGKQVAVNGNAMIQGADPNKLKGAAEKLGGLAKKRAEE